MMVELKDIMSWGMISVAGLAQFFHLKSRVAMVEALQKRDHESFRSALNRIDGKLDRIGDKLDDKADKAHRN